MSTLLRQRYGTKLRCGDAVLCIKGKLGKVRNIPPLLNTCGRVKRNQNLVIYKI